MKYFFIILSGLLLLEHSCLGISKIQMYKWANNWKSILLKCTVIAVPSGFTLVGCYYVHKRIRRLEDRISSMRVDLHSVEMRPPIQNLTHSEVHPIREVYREVIIQPVVEIQTSNSQLLVENTPPNGRNITDEKKDEPQAIVIANYIKRESSSSDDLCEVPATPEVKPLPEIPQKPVLIETPPVPGVPTTYTTWIKSLKK